MLFAEPLPPCTTRHAKRKISDANATTAWGPITPEQAQPTKKQRHSSPLEAPWKSKGGQMTPRATIPIIHVNCRSSPITSHTSYPNCRSTGHRQSHASCATDLLPGFNTYSQHVPATLNPAWGHSAQYQQGPAQYHPYAPQQQIAANIQPPCNPIHHNCSSTFSPAAGSPASAVIPGQGPDPCSATSYWLTSSGDAWAAPARPSSAGLGNMPTRAEFAAAAAGSHTYPTFYDAGFCPLPQEAPEGSHPPAINPYDFLAPLPPTAALSLTPVPVASHGLLTDPAAQWDCSGSAAALAAQAQNDPSTDPLPFLVSTEDILDGRPQPDGLDPAFTTLQQPMQQDIPTFPTLDGQPLGLTEPVPAPKGFSMPPSSMSPEHDDFNLADHIVEDPEVLLDDEIIDLMSEGDDVAVLADFLRETFPELTDDDDAPDRMTDSTGLADFPVKDPRPNDDHILDPASPSHNNAPAMGEWQKLLLEPPNTEPYNTQATQAVLPEQPMVGRPKTQATQAELPKQPPHIRHQRSVGAWKRAPTYPYHHIGHANPEAQESGLAPSSMHQVREADGRPECAHLIVEAVFSLTMLVARWSRTHCTPPTSFATIRACMLLSLWPDNAHCNGLNF